MRYWNISKRWHVKIRYLIKNPWSLYKTLIKTINELRTKLVIYKKAKKDLERIIKNLENGRRIKIIFIELTILKFGESKKNLKSIPEWKQSLTQEINWQIIKKDKKDLERSLENKNLFNRRVIFLRIRIVEFKIWKSQRKLKEFA